jgi:type 1 fimbriae regulatory protein FimB/type 1 fimbriae regulatory protein FimE
LRGAAFLKNQRPEVDRLMKAAKYGRYAQRDATLILIAFRHGLRASEIANLEWSQVEWGRNPTLHVRRAKKGTPSAHPIPGDELRALRELQRNTTGALVFATERGGPFAASAINRLIKRIGNRAGFEFMVSRPHLEDACGYALANRGHDTRGAASLFGPQEHPTYRQIPGIESDEV